MNREFDLDPIAALCGEEQPMRTREERELDRLRDLLARAAWSGQPSRHGMMPWPENVCILAGIDPEGIGDVREDAFPMLPGAFAFYGFPDGYPRDRADLHALSEGVREHIGLLLGLRLPTSRPRVAIEAAAEAGLMPPWLEEARGDAECADLLPVAWRKEPNAGAKPERTPFQQAQKDRRGRQAAENKVTIAIDEVGKETFTKIYNEGFRAVGGTLHRKRSAVARLVEFAIQKAYEDQPEYWPEDTRAIIKRLPKWLAELKQSDPPAGTVLAGAEV